MNQADPSDNTPYIDLTDQSSDPPYDSIVIPPNLPPGWKLATAVGEQIKQAEQLEYQVFSEIGFCEESPLKRAVELDPWREQSRFRIVESDSGSVQGVVRILVGDYDDLPIGSFARNLDFPPNPCLECASLAVPNDIRNTGVAEALYRGVWQDAVCSGSGGLVAIGADWLLEILNDSYLGGFRQLGPGRWYMGGDCIPVGADVAAIVETLKEQPSILRWLMNEIDVGDIPIPAVRNNVITTLDSAVHR